MIIVTQLTNSTHDWWCDGMLTLIHLFFVSFFSFQWMSVEFLSPIHAHNVWNTRALCVAICDFKYDFNIFYRNRSWNEKKSPSNNDMTTEKKQKKEKEEEKFYLRLRFYANASCIWWWRMLMNNIRPFVWFIRPKPKTC